MTAQHVINHFKLIFSEYGWPDTLVSDNGSCYASEAFTKIMQEYNVNHITGSPHYPQSNGLVEKFVQIVKNLFHKAREEGADLFKALMMYRNTLLASICNHLCRCIKAELLGHNCQCQMQQGNSLDFKQKCLESR